MKQRLKIYFFLVVVCVTSLGQIGCGSRTEQAQVAPSPSPAALAGTGAGTGAETAPTSGAALPEQPASAPAATGLAAPAGGAPPMAAAPAPPPAPPRTFTLASGKAITVWTSEDLSTKTHKDGEPFVASLAEPIVDGDWVIAKKGARVEGVVVNADPGGRVKGVASLTVELTRLALADGSTVAISTSNYTKQARTTKKKDALKVGIGAGVGAAIGAIAGGRKGAAIGAGSGAGAGAGVVMATRGDPAVIAGESRLTVRLEAPVKITKK
ncbi:MAG: hypothetical protein SF339_15465 [Blastocatellia bacterium]|nr:hypothetical protein [Blastocatellia bacterium]